MFCPSFQSFNFLSFSLNFAVAASAQAQQYGRGGVPLMPRGPPGQMPPGGRGMPPVGYGGPPGGMGMPPMGGYPQGMPPGVMGRGMPPPGQGAYPPRPGMPPRSG